MLGDEGDVAKPHVARHDALALRAGRRILDALAHHVVRHLEHTADRRCTTSRSLATSASATTVSDTRFSTSGTPLTSQM